jgi:hypothetical protein
MPLAAAYRHNFTLDSFRARYVRHNDAADALLGLLDAADENAVVKRLRDGAPRPVRVSLPA